MYAFCVLSLALQAPCDAFLVDSVGDQIVRLAELDGLPGSTSVHEVTALWRSATPLTPRALDFRREGGEVAAYWVESTRDRLFRAVDQNGNGVLEPFETAVYRESGKLDGASQPVSLAATDDGAVWWCSDQGFAGLFRCADTDGDGLAASPGELRVLVDGAAGTHVVETDAGPVSIDADHLVRLASDGDGVVAYGTGADEALFRFEDRNGDGDVVDPGESRLFLNASGKNPALPRNADWVDGDLPSLVVPGSFGGSFHGRLTHLASATESGTTVWYFACDSHAFSIYGQNASKRYLNGLVFRGEDQNGDGDLQDHDEVRLFYDGSYSGPTPEPLDQILGLDVCGEEVQLAYLYGFSKRVARLVDGNGDGRAHDPGEAELERFGSGVWGAAAPFTGGSPLVRDLVVLEPDAWAEPNALFEVSGDGCSRMISGVVPTLHGVGRARMGSAGFTCELRGALAGTPAFLFVADDLPAWYPWMLPLDLSVFGYYGCTLHVRPLEIRRVRTSGPPGHPSAGYASVTFDVPDDPAFANQTFWLQWVVTDPLGSPYLGTPSVALTGRGQIVVEP